MTTSNPFHGKLFCDESKNYLLSLNSVTDIQIYFSLARHCKDFTAKVLLVPRKWILPFSTRLYQYCSRLSDAVWCTRCITECCETQSCCFVTHTCSLAAIWQKPLPPVPFCHLSAPRNIITSSLSFFSKQWLSNSEELSFMVVHQTGHWVVPNDRTYTALNPHSC